MGKINFAVVFMKRMMAIAVCFVFLFGFAGCKKNLSPGNYQVSITAAGQVRSGVPDNLGIDYQIQVDIQETAGVGGTIISTTIRLCEDFGFYKEKVLADGWTIAANGTATKKFLLYYSFIEWDNWASYAVVTVRITDNNGFQAVKEVTAYITYYPGL